MDDDRTPLWPLFVFLAGAVVVVLVIGMAFGEPGESWAAQEARILWATQAP